MIPLYRDDAFYRNRLTAALIMLLLNHSRIQLTITSLY